MVLNVYPAGRDVSTGEVAMTVTISGGAGTELSATVQTVVEIAIVFVVTELSGQFVTVGGHLLIVYTEVLYTVEVVRP
jgi:hypothetical protein